MQNNYIGKYYPYVPISEHIQMLNSSTSEHAVKIFEEGSRANLICIIFKPKVVLLKSLFLKGGIFKGLRGIIISVLNAYEEFLTQLKLWEIQKTAKRYEK